MKRCNPKVSVVVPVYNVEKYVAECLESILAQTLSDIEVIVLNDGSTDNSENIIKKYADQDSRIKLYRHENHGLGPTRNWGITLASGEYLAFVDSDDTIAPDMLKNLYSKAVADGADIVEGEVMLMYDDPVKNRIRTRLSLVRPVQITNENKGEIYASYYFPRIISHNAWDKLYNIKFITDNHIWFGDNKKIFAEDNWFQLQAFLALPKISFVDKVVYYYRQREDSIMHKPQKDLLRRHSRMISDYTELLNMHGNQLADRQLKSLVAADVLIMEALNQINCGGSKESYLQVLSGMNDNVLMKQCIMDITRIKAYKLEPKKTKRICLVMLSWLYRMGCIEVAHRFWWRLYKR